MSIDHSKTYKKLSLRNYFHIARLRKIESVIEDLQKEFHFDSYCDMGCSNGYITNLVSTRLNCKQVSGFDHSDNISIAQSEYPSINFVKTNLNDPLTAEAAYDLVTCFETMEHVGDISTAIENVAKATKRPGVIFITVPIEIGLIGVIKFILKTVFFRYSLQEIDVSWKVYFLSLLKGERVSKHRSASNGYGTHFGFDYRDVGDALDTLFPHYQQWSSGTTRFYVIKVRAQQGLVDTECHIH